MDNPFISAMPYCLLSKLQKILDVPSTMESFLEVIPDDCSCEDVRISMKIEGMKYAMTPAKYLLQFLGNKGYRVSHLIQWFEAMEFDRALSLLKGNEALKILQHPTEMVSVKEGQKLVLSCKAESYPPPEYKWFRNGEELLKEIDPVLFIENVRASESGIYCCQLTRWNSDINAYDYMYSNSSYVEVNPGDQFPHLFECSESIGVDDEPPGSQKVVQPVSNNDDIPSRAVFPNFPNQIFKTCHQNLSDKEHITISKHPFVYGKVPQGMSICLLCEASSSLPINFQWLKDGVLLPGANSDLLMLPNLYPDPLSGKMRWEFQCAVSSEYELVLSRVAAVELNEVNNLTPLYASAKIAFLVANDTYDNLGNLLTPAADVIALAKLLSEMNFLVLAFRNLTLSQMKRAFKCFCQMLKPNSYALFSFSGHGFEMYQTYLQPVDCSESFIPEESLCTEYVLQCMQETKPALNVLLIDSCRKPPPDFSEESCLQNAPGKVFQAKMKDNTIYCYSTCFLCPAAEKDEEKNSFFIKHLKKYLQLDKPIEEIFFMVKQEFHKDPVVKELQYPVLKSSLALPRKLTDNIYNSSVVPSTGLLWCDIKRNFKNKIFNFEKMFIKLTVEFHHHQEVFCNGLDLYLYLDLCPQANMRIVEDMEINIKFNSPLLKVEPLSGIYLQTSEKFNNLCIGKSNLLLQKEISNLQKVETQELEAMLIIKLPSKDFILEKPFKIDVSEFSGLQLYTDCLNNLGTGPAESTTPTAL